MDAIKDFFFGPTTPRADFLYKGPHLITLAAVIIATIAVIIIFKNKSLKTKRIFLYILTGFMLLMEITNRVVHFMSGGKILDSEVIPMHFCSIMVWVLIIATLTNNRYLYTLGAMGGLAATIAFLLYPGVGFNKEVLKFRQYYSIISHALGFVVSVYLISGGFAKFRFKEIWVAIIFLVANYIYAFILNYAIYKDSNANFMYYRESLFDVPFPVWIVIYCLIVGLYFSSFYFISFGVDKAKERKAKKLSDASQSKTNSTSSTA